MSRHSTGWQETTQKCTIRLRLRFLEPAAGSGEMVKAVFCMAYVLMVSTQLSGRGEIGRKRFCPFKVRFFRFVISFSLMHYMAADVSGENGPLQSTCALTFKRSVP